MGDLAKNFAKTADLSLSPMKVLPWKADAELFTTVRRDRSVLN